MLINKGKEDNELPLAFRLLKRSILSGTYPKEVRVQSRNDIMEVVDALHMCEAYSTSTDNAPRNAFNSLK